MKYKGKRIILIDSNKNFIQSALDNDLEAIRADVYDDELTDNIELNDVGYLIAMTGSDAVNNHALNRFSKDFGEHGAYKLASSVQLLESSKEDKEWFFTPNDDYINLSEAYRENPDIIDVKITHENEYTKILELLSKEEKSVPLFVEKNGGIYLIPEFEKTGEPKENLVLSYLGKDVGNNYKSNSKV